MYDIIDQFDPNGFFPCIWFKWQGIDMFQIDNITQDTLIHLAIKNDKSVEMVEFFVENGLDIHSRNNKEQTPIILCGKHKRLDILKYLISKGGNINDEDDRHDTALLWSSYNDDLEMVSYLVENGADTNHVYIDNKNALMWSIRMNNQVVSEYLIQHTLFTNQTDNNDLNIYDLCKTRSARQMIRDWIILHKIIFLKYFMTNKSGNKEYQLLSKIFEYFSDIKYQ